MISIINKINPGRDESKIFGCQFNTITQFNGVDLVVLSEIRVESEILKVGDEIKLDYDIEFDEFRPLSKNIRVCLAYKYPVENSDRTFYKYRCVTMEDAIKMLETQKAIEKLRSEN